MPKNREHFGLKQFSIQMKTSAVPGTNWKMTAKNADQAWAKFVAQYFRSMPLKPARSDYTIKAL